jgi:hypothetical protein
MGINGELWGMPLKGFVVFQVALNLGIQKICKSTPPLKDISNHTAPQVCP